MRDVFQKMTDTIDKNHEFQKASTTAMEGLRKAVDELAKAHKEAMSDKLWKLIYFLLGIILTLIGIKVTGFQIPIG